MPNQTKFTLLTMLTNVSHTTTANHTAVDLAPYNAAGGRQLKAILVTAAPTTSSTIDVTIQENPTSSGAAHASWSDITDAAFTQVTDTHGNEEMHFKTNARYIRAVSTFGSTATAAVYTVLLQVEKKMV